MSAEAALRSSGLERYSHAGAVQGSRPPLGTCMGFGYAEGSHEKPVRPFETEDCMVQGYSRSDAGALFEPERLRPPQVLEQACEHLVTHVLGSPNRSWDPLYLDKFDYISNRFRKVRQDFRVQLLDEATPGRLRATLSMIRVLLMRLAVCTRTVSDCKRLVNDKKTLSEMVQDTLDLPVEHFRANHAAAMESPFVICTLLLYRGLRYNVKTEDRGYWCLFSKPVEGVAIPEPSEDVVDLNSVYQELAALPPQLLSDPRVAMCLKIMHVLHAQQWFEFLRLSESLPFAFFEKCVLAGVFAYVRFRAVFEIASTRWVVGPDGRAKLAKPIFCGTMPLEEFTRRGLFRCSQEAALFLTHAAIGCYEPEGNDFRKLTLDEIEAAGESALDKRGVILLQDLAKVSQAEVEAGHDRTKLIMPVADSFFGLARYRIDTEVRVGGPVEAGPPPRKKPAAPRRRADVDPDWEPSGGEDEEESDAGSSGDDVQSSAPPSGSDSYPEGGSDDDAEASNMFASDDDNDDDDDDDGGEDAGDEESDNVDDANDDGDEEEEEDGEEDDDAEEDAQEEEEDEDDDFGDVVGNDDGEVLDAADARLPTLPAQAPLCGQLQRGSTVPLTSPYCPLDYLAILRDDEAQEAAHVAEMKRREERAGDEADEDAVAEAADADADDGDVDDSDDDAADEEAEAIARVLAASRAVPLVASGVYRDFFASKDAGQRQSFEDTEQAAREIVAGDERLHRDRLGGSEAADRQRAAAKESVRTKTDELERLKALQQLARQKEQDARQVQQATQKQQTLGAPTSSAKGDGVATAPANEAAAQRSGAFEEQRVRGPTPARAQQAEASASDVSSVSSDSSVVVVAPAASAPTPTPQPAVAPPALPHQEPRKAPPAVITVDDSDDADVVEPQPKVPQAPPRRSVAGSRAHLDAARRAIGAARDRLRPGGKRGRPVAASGAPALPPVLPAPGLLAAIGTRLLLWLLSGGAREAHRSSQRKLNRHLLFSAGMKFELPPECEPAPGSNDMCVATNLFLLGALPRACEGHDHPRQRGLAQAVAAILSDRPMQCRAVSGTKLAHARRDVAAAEIAAFSGSVGLRRVPDAIQMQRASVSLQVTTHAIAFGDETMLAGARCLDQPLIVVVVLESDDDVSDALTSLENLLSSHVNGAPIAGGDGSAAALLRGCVAVIDEAACPDGERMLTQAVSIANARASSRVPLGTVPVRRVVDSGCDVVQAVRDTVMSVVTAAYSVCDVPQVSAADASFNMLPAFEA